jgi:hypothetical protein
MLDLSRVIGSNHYLGLTELHIEGDDDHVHVRVKDGRFEFDYSLPRIDGSSRLCVTAEPESEGTYHLVVHHGASAVAFPLTPNFAAMLVELYAFRDEAFADFERRAYA